MEGGWARGADPLNSYLRLHLGEPGTTDPDHATPDQVNALSRITPVILGWDLRRGTVDQPLWELGEYGLPTSPRELERWLSTR